MHGVIHEPRTKSCTAARTRAITACVKAAGKPVELLVGEGYNHFEVLEALANPYGLLGRAMLAQMKLA